VALMRTLGVDPGTALLGYGIVESEPEARLITYGVIETESRTPMPERLLILFDGVNDLVARFHPDVVAVEQLFFARNATTAIAVGQARGVVLLAAAHAAIPVFEYSPTEVKQAIVGYGRAEKRQMQEMVRLILNLDFPPQPDDAADALAVALCHAQTAPFAARILEER
jgi:crossover junction endodeoxyribonuclease RuvC